MVNENLLRGKIASCGLTQAILAEKLKMTQNTLSAKIKGRSQFTLDEVLKMCDLLDINSDTEIRQIFLA